MTRQTLLAALLVALPAPALVAQCLETQTFVLTPSDGKASDRFGWWVDGTDSWLAASFKGPNDDGGVYLFRRDRWQKPVRIDAPVPGLAGRFGDELAIDDDWLVVAEPYYDNSRGRVHLYQFDGVTWQPTQILEGTQAQELFGLSVAIDAAARLMAVGTTDESVDLFELRTSWSKLRRLVPLVPGSYGYDVSVCGNRVAVGAPLENGGAGAVYLYTGSGTSWPLEQKLTYPGLQAGDKFGLSLVLAGSDLVVGVPWLDVIAGDEGAVATYRYDGAAWNLDQTLISTMPHLNGQMGHDVDLLGDVLLASDGLTAPNGGWGVMAQYRRQGTPWILQQLLYDDPSLPYTSQMIALLPGDQAILTAPYASQNGNVNQGAIVGTDLTDLSLDVEPNQPALGANVFVNTCGGPPAWPVMLCVVGVDGVPFFQFLLRGNFDGQGSWTLVGSHNDPALSGISLDLQSYGLDAAGKVRATGVDSLQLQ